MTAQFLALGDIAWDFLLRPHQEIIWGSDVHGDVKLLPGGVAANFSVWASRLGMPTRLCGKIGDDRLGRLARENLLQAGVKDALITVAGVRTACYGVLVAQDGARAFIQDKGPALLFSEGDLPETLLEGCGLLYFTGYSVFVPGGPEVIAPFLAHARQRKIKIAFDAGSFQQLADFGINRLWQTIGTVDFLLANEDETRVLCPEGSDYHQLLAQARHVILKKGGQGAGYLHGDQELWLPAPTVEVQDTTGAGDAFNAAFLVDFFQKQDARSALKQAIALGARLVETLGSQPSGLKA